MKESSGKTKKVSKGVRRVRSVRNMVMMVLVCVLMLSAATYAWFTLSSSAKVANLTMQVGAETSLMIAPDMDKAGNTGTAGTYGSVLSFGTDEYNIKYALQPATMDDAGKIYSPKYNNEGNKVEGTEAITTENIMTDSSASDTGKFYCYKTTFFLKTAGDKDVQVRLKAPTATMTAYEAPTDGVGTYVVNSTTSDLGAGAIRIKLSTDSGSIVYEPLSDYTLPTGTYESAEDTSGATAITSTDKQKQTGAFDTTAGEQGQFTVKTTDTRVTMEVWLEGTDSCCVNQIMADQIIGQIAFEVIE